MKSEASFQTYVVECPLFVIELNGNFMRRLLEILLKKAVHCHFTPGCSFVKQIAHGPSSEGSEVSD